MAKKICNYPSLKGNNSYKKYVKTYNFRIKPDTCKWSINKKSHYRVDYKTRSVVM